MLGGQPSAGLGQHTAVTGADLRRQRRGRMPALDPLRPAGRRPLDRHQPGTVLKRRWRVSVTERGHGPVDAIKRGSPILTHRGIAAQPQQQVAGQVLQQRAAIEQEHLGDHRGQVRLTGTVTPAGQHLADLPDGVVHRLAAEDPPGQARALEAADAVERGEPGQQVGIGQDVGAGVGADLARPCPAEVLTAGVDEVDPILLAPAPERSLQITAAHQHQPGRIPRVSGSRAASWSQRNAARASRSGRTSHPMGLPGAAFKSRSVPLARARTSPAGARRVSASGSDSVIRRS